MGTGWTSQSGYQQAAFRQEGDRIYLRGNLNQAATANTVIATLPTGSRPLVNHLMYAGNYQPTPGVSVMRVDVLTTGVIQFSGAPNQVSSNLTLDGISFAMS